MSQTSTAPAGGGPHAGEGGDGAGRSPDGPDGPVAEAPSSATRPGRGERTERCRWCGRAFAPHRGPGRPRRFCRPGCRQQAYLARKLAAAHGLGDDDVIVGREALEDLQSRLYCLQAALEDVERDLAASREPADVAEALAWLQENARPLAEVWIEPRTADPSGDGA